MNIEKTKFLNVAMQWVEDKRGKVKSSTLQLYEDIIYKHLAVRFIFLKDVNATSVQSMVDMLALSGIGARRLKSIVGVVAMIKNHAMIRNYADEEASLHNPREWMIHYPDTEVRREPELMSALQQRTLIGYLLSNPDERNAGILLCMHTGLRIGELCGLKWGDVDVKKGIIMVKRTVSRMSMRSTVRPHTQIIISTPKTRSSRRTVPIASSLLPLLKALRSRPDDFLLTASERPSEPRTFRSYYQRVLARLGLPHFKFHSLRHSFATRCIAAGCDYKTVSEFLGHARVATTLDLYVHPDLRHQRRWIERTARVLMK